MRQGGGTTRLTTTSPRAAAPWAGVCDLAGLASRARLLSGGSVPGLKVAVLQIRSGQMWVASD
eukprot:5639743-Alexandrium_andersonii.AAC.1